MTTLALPKTIEQPVERKQGSRLGWAIQDTLTVTWRNIIALSRNQQTIMFSAIQPIMFMLLFVYVFGGAIHTRLPYVDYLIPGIYVQTVTFGAVSTAVGLSEDLHKGLIERFRALPMARSAVLAGRTTADLVRNVFVVILITIVGFAVGFRIGTNFGLFLCGLPDRPAVLLHAVLGVRHGRPVGAQRRGGTDDGVPDPLPVDLRVVGLRAGDRHAGMAASLRQASARDAGRRRLSLADDWRPAARHGSRLGGRWPGAPGS